MVTDQQVLLLRRRIMDKTQQASAAAAGRKGRSQVEEEIVPLLRRDAREKLQATVLLEWLDERYPGRFNASQ